MREHLPTIAPEVAKALGALGEIVQELLASAFVDAVTELLNGTALEKFEKARDRTPTFGAIFMDLTGFKEINDRHGHEGGDAALSETGRRVTPIAKRHKAVAFRKHGDEFVLLTEDHGSTRNCALEIADLVSAGLEVPFHPGGEAAKIVVRGAVGFSLRQDLKTTLNQLIGQADMASRVAKLENARGPVEWIASFAQQALIDLRRKCEACGATTALLVHAEKRKGDALTRCANCGTTYGGAAAEPAALASG